MTGEDPKAVASGEAGSNTQKLTLGRCVVECLSNDDFRAGFTRLTGIPLEAKERHPLERLVDQATGYEEVLALEQDLAMRAFIAFVVDVVWNRLPPEIRAPIPAQG